MTKIQKKPAQPRTKPPQVRCEELLDAAEKLFLARGIAATSVDAIVAGADVAKGTSYLHFASKEQLLAALRQALLLAAGNSAGAWSVEDPSLNATMLFHALHAALDEAAARKSNAHRRKLVRALQAFFERALGMRAGAIPYGAPPVL